MAPIHHHFELCGWSETRVVAVFSVITALLCLIALMGYRKWISEKRKYLYSVPESAGNLPAVSFSGKVRRLFSMTGTTGWIGKRSWRRYRPEEGQNVEILLGELTGQQLEGLLDELSLVVMSPGVRPIFRSWSRCARTGSRSGERSN